MTFSPWGGEEQRRFLPTASSSTLLFHPRNEPREREREGRRETEREREGPDHQRPLPRPDTPMEPNTRSGEAEGHGRITSALHVRPSCSAPRGTMRARPVTFPQRPLEEGKALEAPQSVQDRFQGVSPRSDSKFRFRQGAALVFQEGDNPRRGECWTECSGAQGEPRYAPASSGGVCVKNQLKS